MYMCMLTCICICMIIFMCIVGDGDSLLINQGFVAIYPCPPPTPALLSKPTSAHSCPTVHTPVPTTSCISLSVAGVSVHAALPTCILSWCVHRICIVWCPPWPEGTQRGGGYVVAMGSCMVLWWEGAQPPKGKAASDCATRSSRAPQYEYCGDFPHHLTVSPSSFHNSCSARQKTERKSIV